MMKKILALSIICLLVMTGMAFGVDSYETENAVIIGPNRGSVGITPYTKVMKVRYGYCPAAVDTSTQSGLSSGDVVCWDTTSADGYTISACLVDATDATFAGVLVTSVTTADDSAVKAQGRNVAYVATEGYCLANIDITQATDGQPLVTLGATRAAAFGTADILGRYQGISQDIGVLLKEAAADGLAPVWLR